MCTRFSRSHRKTFRISRKVRGFNIARTSARHHPGRASPHKILPSTNNVNPSTQRLSIRCYRLAHGMTLPIPQFVRTVADLETCISFYTLLYHYVSYSILLVNLSESRQVQPLMNLSYRYCCIYRMLQ